MSAQQKGCICSVRENNNGLGARTVNERRVYIVNPACPLHGAHGVNESQTVQRLVD